MNAREQDKTKNRHPVEASGTSAPQHLKRHQKRGRAARHSRAARLLPPMRVATAAPAGNWETAIAKEAARRPPLPLLHRAVNSLLPVGTRPSPASPHTARWIVNKIERGLAYGIAARQLKSGDSVHSGPVPSWRAMVRVFYAIAASCYFGFLPYRSMPPKHCRLPEQPARLSASLHLLWIMFAAKLLPCAGSYLIRACAAMDRYFAEMDESLFAPKRKTNRKSIQK